jgi:hypothetical protein
MREQLGCGLPPRLILEIDIGKLLAVVVANDEAGIVVYLDIPGRREAAGGHSVRGVRSGAVADQL